VCRDFLELEVRRLLDELGVTLITVSAYSKKAELFGTLAASLTQSNQSFVAVANNPVFSGDVQAIFAAPFRSGWVQSCAFPGSGYSLPALCMFDMRTGAHQWYSC
jgi:hypothetical protein